MRLTMMPSQEQKVQKPILRPYRICPTEMRGQKTFAYTLGVVGVADGDGDGLTSKAGKMLKKATRPFGVVGGTKSSAAERIIT